MADSRKLTILKRLSAVLEGITPGNGYDYDLTGKVHRGRMLYGKETASPFLSIIETEMGDDNASFHGRDEVIRLEEWPLHLQGWLEGDDEQPTDRLYGLMAAAEKRLATEVVVQGATNENLGGAIIRLRILPGMVLAATPEIGGIECFYLPMLLRVAIDLRDPWKLSRNLG